MAPQTNLSLIFNEVPPATPIPGKHLRLEDRPLDINTALPTNHVRLEHIYASLDPYMRGRMTGSETDSYIDGFAIGQPLDGGVVARVLESTSTKFQPGDIVTGHLPIQEYSIQPVPDRGGESDRFTLKKLHNPHNITDLRLFLGPLGMPGLTAFSSYYEIGQPQAGETIFISSAAGAVGQMVGTLAKRDRLKVIGSVGSPEKLRYIVDELGFDDGFNYKQERPLAALHRLAPEGIDIYYENVGGEQLDAALACMKDFGRLVTCGMISDYNNPPEKWHGSRNVMYVVDKRLTMKGFIVTDANMGPKYKEQHQERVGAWLQEGSMAFRIDEMGTIETADRAFVGMLEGRNFGKAVVSLARSASYFSS